MRDWKRWTAVLLAGSLAFTAADDMKLIVQAYEMQNEQGQESYQAESKSKLDDLKEKAVLFQEFQGEEQRFDGTRAVDVSDQMCIRDSTLSVTTGWNNESRQSAINRRMLPKKKRCCLCGNIMIWIR